MTRGARRIPVRRLVPLLIQRRHGEQEPPEPPELVERWNYKLDGTWKLGEKPFMSLVPKGSE